MGESVALLHSEKHCMPLEHELAMPGKVYFEQVGVASRVPPPPDYVAPSTFDEVAATRKMFPPLESPRMRKEEMCSESFPSVGSQLHGVTLAGEPKCQPCAWFHKVS